MRWAAPSLGSVISLAVSCSAAPPPEIPATPPAPGATATASAPSEQAAPAARASSVVGSVGGQPLTVKSAVFMWRAKANDMQVVLADTDGLCEALTAGAWPKGATVLYFTIKHTAQDNRDDPFKAGDYPLRAGSALQPQDTKQAVFMKLDGSCSPVTTVKATAGAVHLSTPEVALGGGADGSFELTIGASDKIEGRFSAIFCPPPENEPRGCGP